jgi:uncharacterized protein YbjT (DUF2867 family)
VEQERIAVTGATGVVGGQVARALAAAGVPTRLVVRDPARAPELAGSEVAVATYGDGDAVARALSGQRTVFMVSAAEDERRRADHLTFVAAAHEAGVERIVYLSFLGAAPDATFTLARDHWATEEAIRATGVAFTFLRDSLYADYLSYFVGEDDTLRGPAGDGRLSAVAQADAAAVAAAVLIQGSAHDGVTYDVTGPEALTLQEAADLISAAWGRPVRYVDETLDEAYASRAHYGAPQWQVDAWVSTYTAIAAGELAPVSDTVPRLTGRPAVSLAELLERAKDAQP